MDKDLEEPLLGCVGCIAVIIFNALIWAVGVYTVVTVLRAMEVIN